MDKNKIHYCPVGLIQRQFGIYVTGAGMEETKPGEPYPHAYHSSDYYFTWRKGRALTDWEYQIALRIRRAMHLLESTDLPIARIAEETGFESHAYFSRLFHARVGTPPIQFRLAHAS